MALPAILTFGAIGLGVALIMERKTAAERGVPGAGAEGTVSGGGESEGSGGGGGQILAVNPAGQAETLKRTDTGVKPVMGDDAWPIDTPLPEKASGESANSGEYNQYGQKVDWTLGGAAPDRLGPDGFLYRYDKDGNFVRVDPRAGAQQMSNPEAKKLVDQAASQNNPVSEALARMTGRDPSRHGTAPPGTPAPAPSKQSGTLATRGVPITPIRTIPTSGLTKIQASARLSDKTVR